MTNERLTSALSVRRAITSCTRCELRKEARAPIPWSGPLRPTFAVLGEAPGRTEDKEGRPFVGVAGRTLRRALAAAGIDENKTTFMNSACCYPSVTHTPTKEHLDACRTNLIGQLKTIAPTYLIVVGGTALSTITNLPLGQVRGRPMWLEGMAPWPKFDQPIVAMPTYHPAARRPQQRLQMVDDIRDFAEWVRDKAAFPGDCVGVRCKEEVDYFDDLGLAWCAKHKGKQLQLKV